MNQIGTPQQCHECGIVLETSTEKEYGVCYDCKGCFTIGCENDPVVTKRVTDSPQGYGIQPLCKTHADMTNQPVIEELKDASEGDA